MDYQKNARVFKALCDENRWKILDLLKNGEQCGCVLLNKLDISQSTLSHHMKILCDSGIVEGKKAGKWTHYSISQQGVAAAQELLALSCRAAHLVCVCDDLWRDGQDYDPWTEEYRRQLAGICRKLAAEFDAVAEVICGLPQFYKHGKTGSTPFLWHGGCFWPSRARSRAGVRARAGGCSCACR